MVEISLKPLSEGINFSQGFQFPKEPTIILSSIQQSGTSMQWMPTALLETTSELRCMLTRLSLAEPLPMELSEHLCEWPKPALLSPYVRQREAILKGP